MSNTVKSLFDLSQTCVIRDDQHSKVIRYPKQQGGCFYQKDILYQQTQSEPSSRYWSERENMFIVTTQNSPYIVRTAIYDSGSKQSHSVITEDAGLSIDNWLTVQPKQTSLGLLLSHPFQYIAEFLKLSKACLLALYDIHQKDIIHLDIKADNICVPYKPYPFYEGGILEVDYDNLKVIDFTYAIHKFNLLKYPLPIKAHSSSQYQSPLLIKALESQHQHFDAYKNNPCQALDYSVDLYSLGYMLNEIYQQGLVFPANFAFVEEVEAELQSFLDYLLSFSRGLGLQSQAPFSQHLQALEKIDVLSQYLAIEYETPCRFNIDYQQAINNTNSEQKTEIQQASRPILSPMLAEDKSMDKAQPQPNKQKRNMILTAVICLIVMSLLVVNADSIRKLFNPLTVDQLLTSETNTQIWQRLHQGVLEAEESTQKIIKDLSNKLENNLHNETLSDAQRIDAYRKLNRLAVWNVKPAQQALTVFHENYAVEREPVVNTAWWKDAKDLPPLDIKSFIAINHILVANQDRLALLDAADMYRVGSGETQDLVQAKKLYEQVLATGTPQDTYSIAAKEGLFYVSIQQLR